MGKRGGDRRGSSNLQSGSHKALSLREEKAGKKQADTTSVKTKLKLRHLQGLALWASGEGSVPSLAALFGHRLASANEAVGLQPDPSLISCQRCETILQPGSNCTIRIEKNQVKARRRCKKPKNSLQNRVVYKCHFCSHRNLKRGTPEGHMKAIYPPKVKPPLKLECAKSPLEKSANSVKDTGSRDEVSKAVEIAIQAIATDSMSANSVNNTRSIDEVSKVVEIAIPAIATDSVSANSAKDTRSIDEVSQVVEIAMPAIATDYVSANSAKDTRSIDEVSKVINIAMPATDTGSMSANNAKDTRNIDEVMPATTADPMCGVEDTKSIDEVCKVNDIALPATARDSPIFNSPTTPSAKSKVTLEVKKRKRGKSGAKKPAESDSCSAITDAEKTVGASSKRKRKSWTSLKEIAERSEHDNGQNITNLTIPFSL